MTIPAKGKADYLQLGDWNAACYECGMKFKASEMRRNWQGFWTCLKHWTPRQPQDFVRATADIQTPAWIQDKGDTFIFDTLDTEAGGTNFVADDFILTESNDPILLES